MAPISEQATAPPATPLRALVDRYVGYRLSGFPPGVHLGLPSSHLTFIVSIGPPIDVVAQTDPRQSPGRYGCVLGGLQSRTARIAHTGHQEGVGIQLTPLGSRALFGLPAGALFSTSIELADLVGSPGHELWERLQGTVGWSERFAVCDAALLGLADLDVAPAPELAHAWEVLVDSGGAVTVAELARRTGWSRQHLTRRFGDEFGLGPKLAARVIRFERARRLLQQRSRPRTIAEVAARCGFADQAHLAREFADLAGTSPSAWLAAEVPSVQDDEPTTV